MSLWQKNDSDGSKSSPTPVSSAPTASAPPRQAAAPAAPAGPAAHIGQSVEIKGELTGNENLMIDGTVDGKIILRNNDLTIGSHGHISAEVTAKTVVVIGEVVGNVTASERIEIAPTGSVEGDLTAPRVALADGSRFKGSIDMSGAKDAGRGTATPAGTAVPQAASSKP